MKKLKKALCLFLALTMCLGLVNLSALADVDKCDECLWTGGNHSENCSHYSGSKDKEPEKPEEPEEPQKPEEQPEKSEETPKCEHKHCTEKLDEATCEKDGLWKLVCDDCGREVDSHVCLKLEHGYVDGKCKYCGQDEPSAKPGEPENPDSNKCPQIDENGNHKHDVSAVIEEATCSNEGVMTYYCAQCEDGYRTDIRIISALDADYIGQKWEPAGNGQHMMVCHLCGGSNPKHVQYSPCEDKDNDGWCDECGGDVAQVETPCEHNMVWEITDNPTCTKKGNRNYHCTKCDYVEKNESIDPLGHEWGPWTHTDDSLKHFRYCKRDNCDCEYNVYPVTGTHDNWEYFTKEPTCTENGYTEKKCPDCGYTETTVISATDHDWDYEHGEVIVKPTVNKVGTICYTCKNDDSHTKYEALKFSACDQVDENGNHKKEYLVTKEPTCTEKGAAQWWCPSCETVFANVELPAKGHLTKIVVDNEPTCTEKGNEHEVCTVCGFTVENKENPALGHDWSGWLSDGADGHHQVCDRCDIHSGIVEHRFGAWETVKEATATEKGEEKHTCLDCGYVETRETNMLENSGNGSGNNGGSSDTTRYTLTINYVYEDGTQASAPYSQQYTSGGSYNVPSPAIEGYSPDYAQVMGNLRENLTVTVTYTLIEDIGDQDPPLADAPEDKDPIGSNPSETDVPDEQPPLTDISDEEPPLVDSPDQQPPMTDLPAEWPPLAEVADPSATDLVETDISDEDVPLASVPQTGDISLVWYVAVAMSAMGLVALTLKKREDEED